MKTNQLDKALTHAQAEHKRRPTNIDACEILARVYFRMENPTAAAPLMETALRTKSQKPERLVLAGKVKMALGEKAAGEALVAQGMALKPYQEM